MEGWRESEVKKWKRGREKKWERSKKWIVLRGGMEYFCDVMYLIVDFLVCFVVRG